MGLENAPRPGLRSQALAVFAAAAALGGAGHNPNQLEVPGGINPQVAIAAFPDLIQPKDPIRINETRDPYPDPAPGVYDMRLPKSQDGTTVTFIPPYKQSKDAPVAPVTPVQPAERGQDDTQQPYAPPASYSPGHTQPEPVFPEEPYEEPSPDPGEDYPEEADAPLKTPRPGTEQPQPAPIEADPAIVEQSLQLAREAFHNPNVPKHVIDGLLLMGSGKDGEYFVSDPVVFPAVNYEGVVVSIGPDPRAAGGGKPEPALAYYNDISQVPIFGKPGGTTSLYQTTGNISIDPVSDKVYGSFTDEAGRNFGRVLALQEGEIIKPSSADRLAYDKGGGFVLYPRDTQPGGGKG